MNFELLPDKVQDSNLAPDDHIMLNDMLYRVINNFPVIGGGGRMLMLAFHSHQEPRGYKFHHVQHTVGFQVFRRID